MHKRKYTYEEVKDMYTRRLKGETWQSIGDSYNVSRSSIRNLLVSHTNYLMINNVKIPKYYIKISEFAELMGLSLNGLYYHIRNKNIKTIKKDNKLYISRYTIIKAKEKTLSEEKVKAIYALKDKKWTMTKIALALSINRATVSTYLKMRNIFGG